MRLNRPAGPEDAFQAYLAVRHRLPPASFSGTPRRAETLSEIAGPFDLVLLDAYGVLNVGESAIPGAPARIDALRAAGKTIRVVSNSAGYPKRAMMERFARMGFDLSPSEVVTSRETLLSYLADSAPRFWGLMLSPAHGTDELDHLSSVFLGDEPGAYDAVEGFLMIGSDGWSKDRQDRLVAALRARQRPVVVGNPDIVAPRADGLSLEPGYFAHSLADATGAEPRFLGKPFPGIFSLALAKLQSPPPPQRVLMVGDTLHTDILGGRYMGFATALVTDHGSLVGLNVEQAIETAAIIPDFVLGRI